MTRRRRYGFDEAKIQRFIRQKRGLGSGREYKPWLTVRDVPSMGRVHRPYSQKTGREHHLLSDNEYYAFINIHWDDQAIDIREQYPLIDRRETLEIASLCGIRHPVDPISRALWVITTDLLVTMADDFGVRQVAYSIKEAKALSNMRSLEKLEIERRYWERRGVPWYLLTNEQVKNQTSLNLAWIYNSDVTIDDSRYKEKDATIQKHLEELQKTRPYSPITATCGLIDKGLGIIPGESLASLRRLLGLKKVLVDLTSRNILDLQLRALTFVRK